MIKSILLLVTLVLPAVLSAHHSTALNFSQERVTLNGTVTDLKWINPHASFVFVVENEGRHDPTSGSSELLAKIALERQGIQFRPAERRHAASTDRPRRLQRGHSAIQ